MKPKDDDKLRAIAEATFALVEQTGLSGLTMAGIAKAAGLATSTLYVYYPSKDELVGQLYEAAKATTARRMLDGMSPADPVRAQLRCLWHNMLRNRLEHYAEAVFQEQFFNSPWMTPARRERMGKLFTAFLTLFEAGQRQEILKPLPLPLLTGCLMASVRETANLIRSQTLPDDEATRNAAFSLCWDALKA